MPLDIFWRWNYSQFYFQGGTSRFSTLISLFDEFLSGYYMIKCDHQIYSSINWKLIIAHSTVYLMKTMRMRIRLSKACYYNFLGGIPETQCDRFHFDHHILLHTYINCILLAFFIFHLLELLKYDHNVFSFLFGRIILLWLPNL